MKRLMNYLKEGQGKGLTVSLIFTGILACLIGGLMFFTATKVPAVLAKTPFSPLVFALLVGVVTFIILNVFYFLQVFLTWVLAKISFLKLNKGRVFRVSMVTYITVWTIVILLSIIQTLWPTQPFIVPIWLTNSFVLTISGVFLLPNLLLLIPVATQQGIAAYPIPLQNTTNLIYATVIALIVLIILSHKKEAKAEKAIVSKTTKKKKA